MTLELVGRDWRALPPARQPKSSVAHLQKLGGVGWISFRDRLVQCDQGRFLAFDRRPQVGIAAPDFVICSVQRAFAVFDRPARRGECFADRSFKFGPLMVFLVQTLMFRFGQ